LQFPDNDRYLEVSATILIVYFWPVSDQSIDCAQAGFRIASNAPGEKPRPCLTLLTRVGINCAKNSLGQSDIDSGSLISEFTDVNVYDRRGEAAIAALEASSICASRMM
jgi:hypothetical protein